MSAKNRQARYPLSFARLKRAPVSEQGAGPLQSLLREAQLGFLCSEFDHSLLHLGSQGSDLQLSFSIPSGRWMKECRVMALFEMLRASALVARNDHAEKRVLPSLNLIKDTRHIWSTEATFASARMFGAGRARLVSRRKRKLGLNRPQLVACLQKARGDDACDFRNGP